MPFPKTALGGKVPAFASGEATRPTRPRAGSAGNRPPRARPAPRRLLQTHSVESPVSWILTFQLPK